MLSKHLRCASVLAIVVAVLTSLAKTSEAGGFLTEKVYRIEVEYLYWPADYYYWTNYIETTDERDATLSFKFLEFARDRGYLSYVLSASGRHIPVDVRMKCYERPILLHQLPAGSGADLQGPNVSSGRSFQLFD